VSGYAETFIVQHGVLSEGVHFLHKPFTVDRLAAKVAEVLSW
jgi:two-component system, cell cycle sensor histidine kinase and response regulator CckA